MKITFSILAALCVLLLWTPDAAIAKSKRKHLPVTSPGDKNYHLIVSDRFGESKLDSDIWKYEGMYFDSLLAKAFHCGGNLRTASDL